MGNKTASQGSLIAATLNFSGICLSPFEYHDCSVEKDFISETFKKIMDQEIKENDYVWNVGKIDQKLQKQRFAPVYRDDIGEYQNKLLSRENFEKLWDEQFQKAAQSLKGYTPTEQQVKICRLFDWISYRTFVNVVYSKNPKEIVPVANYQNYEPKQYFQFMKKWHSKQYLDNNKKMKKVASYLNDSKVDVLFLQEAVVKGGLKWTDVLSSDDFDIVSRQGEESMIFYRKDKFPEKQDKAFKQKYFDIINWNKDSVFIKRGNFLLICAHLSSKSHNVGQAKQMFENLNTIRKQYPGLEIVIGVDANHFLDPNVYSGFNFIPDVEKSSTTSKKRTWVQLQSSKSNLIVMETKDHLISTRKVNNFFIGTIHGLWINEKVYLPSNEHPFDHFTIQAQLIQG